MQLVDAARALIDEGGPRAATVGAIAERVGAPIGSVYHRFTSREALLARVWLDEVEAFQSAYAAVAQSEVGCRPGDVARHVVDWVRDHPQRARLLVLYRREELVSGDFPDELAARAEAANKDLRAVSKALCRRWFGRVSRRARDAVRLAAFEIPYGAVRSRLDRNEAIPPELSDMVAAAAEAAVSCAKSAKKKE